jgi:hypothetical protein
MYNQRRIILGAKESNAPGMCKKFRGNLRRQELFGVKEAVDVGLVVVSIPDEAVRVGMEARDFSLGDSLIDRHEGHEIPPMSIT